MSVWFVWASVGLTMLASWVLGAMVWRLNRNIGEVASELNRIAIARNDLHLLAKQRLRLKSWQSNTEQGVDGAVQGIETMHFLIARVVFSLFDRLGAPSDKTFMLRQVQDTTSHKVYAALRSMNKLVGSGLRQSLK